MIKFARQLEQVCRTNLFQIGFVTVKKNHVLKALTNLIFDALLGVIIIYDMEPLVMISAQKGKVCRTNLLQV